MEEDKSVRWIRKMCAINRKSCFYCGEEYLVTDGHSCRYTLVAPATIPAPLPTPQARNPGGAPGGAAVPGRPLSDMVREVSEWADIVFPNRTPNHVAIKLFEEIGEFLKDRRADELADVAILIFDLAHLHKIDLEDAVTRKMIINRARRWKLDKDTETMQHE